jgi:hypothetical protein
LWLDLPVHITPVAVQGASKNPHFIPTDETTVETTSHLRGRC